MSGRGFTAKYSSEPMIYWYCLTSTVSNSPSAAKVMWRLVNIGYLTGLPVTEKRSSRYWRMPCFWERRRFLSAFWSVPQSNLISKTNQHHHIHECCTWFQFTHSDVDGFVGSTWNQNIVLEDQQIYVSTNFVLHEHATSAGMFMETQTKNFGCQFLMPLIEHLF